MPEMFQSAEIDKLAAALVEVQLLMKPVPKNKTGQVGNQKTKYADLETCATALQALLPTHQLAYTQTFRDCETGVKLRTQLIHASGQWIAGEMRMPCTKNGPQEVGSAATYARRYSLCAIVGLVADDDDDATAAQREPRQRKQAQNQEARPLPEAELERARKSVFAKSGEVFGGGEAGEARLYAFLDENNLAPLDEKKGRRSVTLCSYQQLRAVWKALDDLAKANADDARLAQESHA